MFEVVINYNPLLHFSQLSLVFALTREIQGGKVGGGGGEGNRKASPSFREEGKQKKQTVNNTNYCLTRRPPGKLLQLERSPSR